MNDEVRLREVTRDTVRAICAGGEPAAFVMIYDPTLSAAPEEPDFFLWRLMIDRRDQGKGYGRAARRRPLLA